MTVQGHRPLLALEVTVQQVFFHCAKAFLRSKLWEPERWAPDALPCRAEIAGRLERPEDSAADLAQYYGPSYAEGLYRRRAVSAARRSGGPPHHQGSVAAQRN